MSNPEVRQIPNNKAEQFILAGKSITTIKNINTGNRFTYKVVKARKQRGPTTVWFCRVLTGPDNCSHYTFIGTIQHKGSQLFYQHSPKSRIDDEAMSVQALKAIVSLFNQNRMFDCIEFWHQGYCGRCGKLLTVPESIEQGFGPFCINKV